MLNQKQIQNYKILGIVFLCQFGLSALVFLFLVGFFVLNIGVVTAKSNRGSEIMPLVIFYAVAVIFYVLFTTPFGVAGWKLYKNKSGAKGWGIAASVLSLIYFFPLGMIIGIIGFILLFSTYKDTYYDYQNQQNFQPPQPPQNWH